MWRKCHVRASAVSMPLLSPCGRLRGGQQRQRGTRRVVVVRTEGVMGQFLATGGCQTLQLLLINVLIINKHVNVIIN